MTLSPEPPAPRSYFSQFENISGVKIYSCGLTRRAGFINGMKRCKEIVSKINPDIIHSHGIRADRITSKLRTKALKVATIHCFLENDYKDTYGKYKGWLMCMMEISYLKKMNVCIGVSKAVADYLKERFGLKNITYICNGIDQEKYYAVSENEKKKLREKLQLPQNGAIFISAGQLIERKDPLFLIKQWVGGVGEHLVFLGNGKLYEKCIEETKERENIHILGYKTNISEYLQAADGYISASRSEGIGLTILEAMSCGLPSLLTDIPAFKEILSYGENLGLSYKFGDENDFKEKMCDFLKLDKEITRNEAIAIAKEFSSEKMAERYQNIYISYLNKV